MNQCKVEDCNNKAKTKQLCIKHYHRLLRYGNVNIVKKRASHPEKCEAGNCDGRVVARGLCQRHYYRLRKYGDPHYTRKGKGYIDGNCRYLYKAGHPNSTKTGKIQEHIYVMSEHLGRELNDNEAVIHINGDRLDNRLENLRIEKKENICKIKRCRDVVHAKGFCSKHYSRFIKFGDPNKILQGESGEGTINENGYRLIYLPDHPNAQDGGRILEHRYMMSNKLGRPLMDFERVHHKNGIRHDNDLDNLELWVLSHPPGQKPQDLVRWAKEILEIYEKDVEEGKV